MVELIVALLLAAPTPPEIDAAIRQYFARWEHEAVQQKHPARQDPVRPNALPGAVGANPTLLAVLRPGATAPVTSAVAGEPLVLIGQNLPPDGQVYIAQRPAIVTSRTSTAYQINAPAFLNPADPRPLTGAVDLFVGNVWSGRLHGTEFTLLVKAPDPEVFIRARVTGTGAASLKEGAILQATAGGLSLSLTLSEVKVGPEPTPAPTPTPQPPTPTPAVELLTPLIQEVIGGVSERRTAPLVGDAVHVRGVGFGAVRGHLLLRTREVPTTSWSDTEVRFTMPPSVEPGPHMVTVITAEGRYVTTGAFGR